MAQSSPPQGSSLRHPGWLEFAMLLSLALVWGSSFLFIKVAVSNGMPPLSLATARIAIGAAILLTVARLRGQSWPSWSRSGAESGGAGIWLRLTFLGIIGNSLPFFLIGWGEQFTTSQLAAILMATIPLLVLILAHVMTHDEKLTGPKIMGVMCGFAGVVVLVGVDALKGLGAQVIGQIAILGGCLSYTFYGVNARRLPQMGAEMTVGIILALGLLTMLPVWLYVDRPWELAPSGSAWFAVLWLGLLSTAFGNWLFFTLMRRSGASFAATNNFLVPVMGLGWGFFGYHEVPGANALVALVLILVGLALPRLRRR
ncbi:DMT family transporter [Dongia mobilis]|uniref:DMT family transporter n=1 Tax=Dongia sp. TaxID=1977262 RepID=UPI0026EAD063